LVFIIVIRVGVPHPFWVYRYVSSLRKPQ